MLIHTHTHTHTHTHSHTHTHTHMVSSGKLVTAKYIEASRYNKWFPHAANATQQLMPS